MKRQLKHWSDEDGLIIIERIKGAHDSHYEEDRVYVTWEEFEELVEIYGEPIRPKATGGSS